MTEEELPDNYSQFAAYHHPRRARHLDGQHFQRDGATQGPHQRRPALVYFNDFVFNKNLACWNSFIKAGPQQLCFLVQSLLLDMLL
jgi:hypothetical protein